MLHEFANVGDTVAERRNVKRHDVQAVVQVLAERPAVHQSAQVAISGGNDARIYAVHLIPADRTIIAVLQHPEEPSLRFQRHIPDLIQEHRAARRFMEASGPAARGTGEGTPLVPEQLALDQLARDRRHVERDERSAPSLAEIVQGMGDELLARSRFARNQNREVGTRQSRDLTKQSLHRR